ncbi:hypothetical protein F5Y15DRAFT_295662 [Xylariaceae sp. FL0016]|nr:hypothetical protein F5Y15DRAFT_295662 [Xylariaceae sp. FL0016]
MAEAQEQPQAQPQPEPVSAAAEEPAHALPRLLLARSPLQPLSQEAVVPAVGVTTSTPPPPLEQEKTQEAQAEAHVQAQASTPPEAVDTNASQNQATLPSLSTSQHPQASEHTISELAAGQRLGQELAKEPGLDDRISQAQGHDTRAAHHSTPRAPSSSSTNVAPSTVATDPNNLLAAILGNPSDQKNDQPGEENGLAPVTTDMSSNTPHPGGQQQQHMNYSVPTSYAAAPMSNTQYGYASSASPGHDPYRTSNALPSMRTFDPTQQQQPQTHQQHHNMAVGMPVTGVPSVVGQQPLPYYGQQLALGSMTGNAYGGLPAEALNQRYALPPGGGAALLTSGRGHKKEIKRRTKTGCLTCRKRRIKCDETHPICKNCQKSKRDCMGYDPIFKNQQQQQPLGQPTNIQPAPSHHSASSSPAIPSNGPAAPTELTAATTASYAPLPPVISNNSAPATASYNLGSVSSGDSSNIKPETLEFPSLDSTLDNVLATSSMSTSHFPAINSATPHFIDPRASDIPHLRGGGPSFAASLYPSASHRAPSPYSFHGTPAYSGSPASTMNVQQLIAMGNADPPVLDTSVVQERVGDARHLYAQVYAPGLEQFFESGWYTQATGFNALASNTLVSEMLAVFLHLAEEKEKEKEKDNDNDPASMHFLSNLEFRVVWEVATLVNVSEYSSNAGDLLPGPADGSEARNRVAVFEALLSGAFLDDNPLFPPLESLEDQNHPEYHRNREFKFWYWLAEFLKIKDEDQPNDDTLESTASSIEGTDDVKQQRETVLTHLREVLDGRENRDVIYSLAIIRALSPDFPTDFTLPAHRDESDPISKLGVARQFIQAECQVANGTTNVVRRFAELGLRAFINPGCNVTRH